MPDKFLKEAVAIVAGKASENIVDYLSGTKYVNEFLIAKKLDLTINQVRNILYKLSDSGLVSSIRKKDKRKGWYTYFWKIETVKALEFLRGNIEKKALQLKSQIESRELKTFYVCERCHIEYNEENALLHDFTCNECGNIFVIKDNTKLLKELKKNLEKQRREISFIDEEIEKEKKIIEKKKARETKKETKKAKPKEVSKKKTAKKKITRKKSKLVKKKKVVKPKKKAIKNKSTKKKSVKKKRR